MEDFNPMICSWDSILLYNNCKGVFQVVLLLHKYSIPFFHMKRLILLLPIEIIHYDKITRIPKMRCIVKFVRTTNILVYSSVIRSVKQLQNNWFTPKFIIIDFNKYTLYPKLFKASIRKVFKNLLHTKTINSFHSTQNSQNWL